jgi:cysteinyl-tRNA synthetase
MTDVVGVAEGDPVRFLERTRVRRAAARGIDPREIDARVRERGEARAARDFARADAIRHELTARGIEVRDVPGGESTWRFVVATPPASDGGGGDSRGGGGAR